jgi:hypothetical protein
MQLGMSNGVTDTLESTSILIYFACDEYFNTIGLFD